MTNVSIEALPKGNTPATLTHYQIEFADGADPMGQFSTQKEAVDEATNAATSP